MTVSPTHTKNSSGGGNNYYCGGRDAIRVFADTREIGGKYGSRKHRRLDIRACRKYIFLDSAYRVAVLFQLTLLAQPPAKSFLTTESGT